MERNSFYDVNQKHYTKEELALYRDLTGMPLYSSYEQLIDSLNREIRNSATSSSKRTKDKQNIEKK